jgi:hypothetical protein
MEEDSEPALWMHCSSDMSWRYAVHEATHQRRMGHVAGMILPFSISFRRGFDLPGFTCA